MASSSYCGAKESYLEIFLICNYLRNLFFVSHMTLGEQPLSNLT